MRKSKQKVLWALFSGERFWGVFTSWQTARAWGRAELLENIKWEKIEVNPFHSINWCVRQMFTSKQIMKSLLEQVLAKNPITEALERYGKDDQSNKPAINTPVSYKGKKK